MRCYDAARDALEISLELNRAFLATLENAFGVLAQHGYPYPVELLNGARAALHKAEGLVKGAGNADA